MKIKDMVLLSFELEPVQTTVALVCLCMALAGLLC